MPRRRVVAKREILPDPKYHSEVLSRFINVVMLNGKKSIAEKIVYGAIENAVQQLASKVQVEDGEGGESGGDRGARVALHIFESALENASPTVEVRSRRVGGATYQIPIEVKANRGRALGMRWLVKCARTRGEKGMMMRLSSEIIDAYERRGAAVKKREESHRMAKANQAFAHFRWT